MRKVELGDIKDLVAYEKVREAMRARVIAIKQERRVTLGDNLTVLFENRDTVLFQIQEMVRTERIVHDAAIQQEIDVYNALLPGPGQLSTTVFIEIPDLSRMSAEKVRETVNRFQGLDRDSLWLLAGASRLPAVFESGHTRDEKMSAVHYVKFRVPEAARAALTDPAAEVRLLADHPRYRAEASLPPFLRRALAEELSD